MVEKAIIGWVKIARMFNASRTTFMRRHKEELERDGFVFYQIIGKPPKRCVCAFPRMLMEWVSEKSKKNEIL